MLKRGYDMKSIEQLKEYYEKDLMKDLLVLEEARKKIANKLIPLYIFNALVFIIGTVLVIILNPIVLILMIGIIIPLAFLAGKISKGYNSDFKERVIKNIVNFIDPNLSYHPDSCIPEFLYMSSKLFPRTTDRYRGDDLVQGKIGETEIKFSEIHSEYKTQSKNGTNWHTIFKGLFFVADFNKRFKSETRVLPDVAQKMFGNIVGNFFQNLNKFRGELIKMDDPEFEKLFVVYGKDQIEARYILSPSLMKRVTEFKKKTKKDIYLSFINNNIFVAITYYKNLFEPKIFSTLINFDVIKEYYEDMALAISIVEELNLNTRIWG